MHGCAGFPTACLQVIWVQTCDFNHITQRYLCSLEAYSHCWPGTVAEMMYWLASCSHEGWKLMAGMTAARLASSTASATPASRAWNRKGRRTCAVIERSDLWLPPPASSACCHTSLPGGGGSKAEVAAAPTASGPAWLACVTVLKNLLPEKIQQSPTFFARSRSSS